MKVLVVIPTYNERENIELLIKEIFKIKNDINILIIDDNSPDKTYEVVDEISKTDSRIFLIKRERKLGLGTAYIQGFRWAIEKGYDIVVQMDGDFSHQPSDIERLLNEIKNGYDLVIGSRYCKGVNVVHWPMRRLMLSYFANFYARSITGVPVKDLTSGFKAIKVEALKNLNLDKIKSNGYAFQIELTFDFFRKGFKIKEIPIIFFERREGNSKMSKNVIFEAAIMVWRLKISSLFSSIRLKF